MFAVNMKTPTWAIPLLIVAALAVSIQAAASNDPPSSAEITDENPLESFPGEKRSRFHSGSRYGRSHGGVDAGAAGLESMNVNVVPRNNRFFTGSRYGKRSDESVQPYFEQDSSAEYVRPVVYNQRCNYSDLDRLLKCLLFHMPLTKPSMGAVRAV